MLDTCAKLKKEDCNKFSMILCAELYMLMGHFTSEAKKLFTSSGVFTAEENNSKLISLSNFEFTVNFRLSQFVFKLTPAQLFEYDEENGKLILYDRNSIRAKFVRPMYNEVAIIKS